MLKIYGSMLCPDCVDCCEALDNTAIEYEFLDFSHSIRNLKEFLSLRDHDPVFDEVREKGSIGIPCIVCEDGSILLDWTQLTSM